MKIRVFLDRLFSFIPIRSRISFLTSISILFLTVSFFFLGSSPSNTTFNSSPEVGFTSTSPNGDQGGVVVPASCPSDIHNTPWYGTACSECNACGVCDTGTIQCGTPYNGLWVDLGLGTWYWFDWRFDSGGAVSTLYGWVPGTPGACSVSAPALPAGYGGGCVSVANNCGSTNPGTITCGGCNAVAPADIPLGSACSGPANACGMTIPGTITCAGCNSTVAPSNALCDLAICKNSCNSSLDRSGNFTVASGTPSTTLKACFYQAGTGACTGGVDVTGSATWTETNAPKDAIYFSPTGVLNARSVNGDETFNTSYLGVTKSPRVTVTCIPNTCSIAPAKTVTDTYCPEVTQDTGVPTGCDGMTLICPGTRKCNYNWREIAP